MAFHSLIFWHQLDDRRDGQDEDERDEEHRRPRDIGGNKSGGQRSDEQAGLEGGGGKAEVGLLIGLAQVLGHVNDIERFRSGKARGLDKAAGKHHGPEAGKGEGQKRTHGDEDNAGEHELADGDGIRQRGVDHGADADDHAGEGSLQGGGFNGDVQRLGDRHGHRLKAVINNQREDEDKEQDRYGNLGVYRGACPLVLRGSGGVGGSHGGEGPFSRAR